MYARSTDRKALLSTLLVLTSLAGCGGDDAQRASASGTGGTGGTPGGCAPNEIPNLDGTCTTIGPQGCADLFIGDDGVCQPAADACPPGTIPKLSEGCVPVGIQGCAKELVGEDGLCHPTIAACAEGTIPVFEKGCVPIGIPGCAAEFATDGSCHVSMSKCPADAFAVPTEGCVPIDGPSGCGSGTFGNIPDGAGTIWVDAAYPGSDSDGSKAHPVTTLGAAMALVAPGGRIALGAGVYSESIAISQPLEIVGVCPSKVRLEGTTPASPTVSVDGTTGVTLRGLEIGGPGFGVDVSHAGVTLDGVVVREVGGAAIIAVGADTLVTLSHVLVRDSQESADNKAGIGLVVRTGAEVHVGQSAFVANQAEAVSIQNPGSKGVLDDVLLAGTLADDGGDRGEGLAVESAGQVEVTSSAFVSNHVAGVIVFDAGSAVSLSGVVVEKTEPRTSDGLRGNGVVAAMGGQISVSSSLLDQNHEAGIVAVDEESAVDATETLVRGTVHAADPVSGRGVDIESGAAVTLASVAIVDNHSVGLYVSNPMSRADATGILIENTLPDAHAGGGRGIEVRDSGAVALRSSAVVGNRETAVLVNEAGSQIDVEASILERTKPRDSDSGFGRGLDVVGGAHATLTSTVVSNNHNMGIYCVQPGSQLALSSVLVDATVADINESHGGYGAGVGVAIQASASLENTWIRANRVAALLVMNAASATVDACLLTGTEAGSFEPVDDQGNPTGEVIDDVGDGLVVLGGSTADVTGSIFTGHRRAGLLFDQSGGTITHALSRSNAFGLVQQGMPIPSYDGKAAFAGNGEEDVVADGQLPVPNAALPIPGE